MKKKQPPRYQQTMFDSERPATRDSGPVTCLGMTFENDEARREHFLGLLREGLEELHAKLDGVPFTTGEDAVERMRSVETNLQDSKSGRAAGTPEGSAPGKARFKWPMEDDARLRELAERMRHADSSKDLLQRWKDEVGFPHGEIEDILNLSDPPYYTACPTVWNLFSRLGTRRAVLNDLSPAAIFIAYNYNTPVDVQAFEREAKRILKEVEEKCGWT